MQIIANVHKDCVVRYLIDGGRNIIGFHIHRNIRGDLVLLPVIGLSFKGNSFYTLSRYNDFSNRFSDRPTTTTPEICNRLFDMYYPELKKYSKFD